MSAEVYSLFLRQETLSKLKKTSIAKPSSQDSNQAPVSELQAALSLRSLSKKEDLPKSEQDIVHLGIEEPKDIMSSHITTEAVTPTKTDKNVLNSYDAESKESTDNVERVLENTISMNSDSAIPVEASMFPSPASNTNTTKTSTTPALCNYQKTEDIADNSEPHKVVAGVLGTLYISKETPADLETLMAANHELLMTLYSGPRKSVLTKSCTVPPLPLEYLHLLWFALPVDAAQSLLDLEPRPRLADVNLPLLPTFTNSIHSSNPKRPTCSCFEIRIFPNDVGDREDSDTSCLSKRCTLTSPEFDEDLVQSMRKVLVQFSSPEKSHSSESSAWSMLNVLKNGLMEVRPTRTSTFNQSEHSLSASSSELSGAHEIKSITVSSEKSMVTQGGPKVDRDGRLEIPRQLRRTVGSAIRDFNMIKEGDRLLVGLSGGKDSLTLLHVLRDAEKRSPIKFSIAAATVDPQTPEYDPSPLVPYLKSLGIEYHFLSYPLIELAKTHMQKDSICAFCSRMKRGILYSCMRKHGYNVLVLGQHLDDICESFVMSAFHNGSLNTMKANYTVGKGDLRVSRPLIYTREKVLAKFAKDANLPVIADNCPACFSQPKERHRVKLLLAQQEFEFPHVFQTLLQTVRPLIAIDEVIPAQQTLKDQSNVNSVKQDDAINLLAHQLVHNEILLQEADDAIVTSLVQADDAIMTSLIQADDAIMTSLVEAEDFKAEKLLSDCGVGSGCCRTMRHNIDQECACSDQS